MSSSTQPTDFSDLYTDLLNRVRADSSHSATSTLAKRYINVALQDMHINFGERFPWCERRDVLITQQPYSTGTVTITQGATALTGASTAWNTNNAFSIKNMRAGGKITINGGVEVYEISSVTNDTAAVLSTKFVQADVTAGTYEYFEDEYALSADFLRPIDQTYFDQERSIPFIGRADFRRRYPRNSTTGKIAVATMIDLAPSGNTTPRRRVKFHQPPDGFEHIGYTFVTNKLVVSSTGTAQTSFSADADEPLVPFNYRHGIVLYALAEWYRDRKNDKRASEAMAQYVGIMARITGDSEIGQERPRIQPRMTPYHSPARKPWRSGSRGRYSTGTAFDQLRD